MSETSTLGLVLAFAGVCVTQIVGLAGVWLAGHRRSNTTDAKIDVASAHADAAATEAATAAKRAEPVSNGFAGTVLESLDGLTRGQVRLAEEMSEIRQTLGRHIGDHAAADVAHRKRRKGRRDER